MNKIGYKKKVYLAFSSDIIYESHVNIIKKASKLGRLTIGLLTDKAIVEYKSLPHLNFEERKNKLLKYKKYIYNIIPQNSLDYSDNLIKLKPEIVVHGTDWKQGIQKRIRNKIINLLKKWSGKLVEFPYDYNFPKDIIKKLNKKIGTNPENRRPKLLRLINCKKFIRIIEAHNPLTGVIAEKAYYKDNKNFKEFDGLWSSSLTDSMVRGKPDNQSVDYSSRINSLNEILEVTTKPIIFDGDNGGKIEHLPYMIRKLEMLGVSAIIIEDKVGLKRNSLFSKQDKSSQDTIKNFSKKISTACSNRISKDFLIAARIESFILGKNIIDAIKRAEAYSKAGADLIFISSKRKDANEVFKFSKKFKLSKYYKPIIAVPSTYSKVNEKRLSKNGIKIVIYANQLLRAAYPAISNVADKILKNERSYETDKLSISIKEAINLIK